MTINEPARIHQQREWRAAVASQLNDLITEFLGNAVAPGAVSAGEVDALVGRMLHGALDKAGVQLAPRVDPAWSTADSQRVEQLWLILQHKLGVTIEKDALAHALEKGRMVLANEPPVVAPINVSIAMNAPAGTSVAALIDELHTLPKKAVTRAHVTISLIGSDVPADDAEEPF